MVISFSGSLRSSQIPVIVFWGAHVPRVPAIVPRGRRFDQKNAVAGQTFQNNYDKKPYWAFPFRSSVPTRRAASAEPSLAISRNLCQARSG